MCFAKVIIINSQLKYFVYRISSVYWLHIYPVLIGVCVVHCAATRPNRFCKRRILTLRLLMSYIYGAPILDVSRSHTTTHHSR